MIRSLWIAATGMHAQQLEQDVIANNLANVNTTGFKKSRIDFQDLMYQVSSQSGSETSTGVQLPSGIQVGLGVKAVSVSKNFSQGDYQQTGNSFDWAIEGSGFYQLDNNGTTVYTRAGNFKLDKDGYLCNPEGLRLVPNVQVPSTAVSFTIDSGGTWSYSDSTGASTTGGRITLARFINPAGLTSMGRNLFTTSNSSGDAIVSNPGEEGCGTITQTYLEQSNVNVIDEMVKMIAGQRAYEINSKAIQTADDMLQVANNIKQ